MHRFIHMVSGGIHITYFVKHVGCIIDGGKQACVAGSLDVLTIFVFSNRHDLYLTGGKRRFLFIVRVVKMMYSLRFRA
jgi:hypothetical protein